MLGGDEVILHAVGSTARVLQDGLGRSCQAHLGRGTDGAWQSPQRLVDVAHQELRASRYLGGNRWDNAVGLSNESGKEVKWFDAAVIFGFSQLLRFQNCSLGHLREMFKIHSHTSPAIRTIR
jgi:hypothetical protein